MLMEEGGQGAQLIVPSNQQTLTLARRTAHRPKITAFAYGYTLRSSASLWSVERICVVGAGQALV